MTTLDLIPFIPNVPQELALSAPERPSKLPGAGGCLYPTSDGRLLHLAPAVADSLRLLALKPGETFFVCLHERPHELPFWTVWLSPATEKARAIEEIAGETLESQLQASIAFRPAVHHMAAIHELAPTGTDGPRLPAPVAIPKRKTPVGIPYNVAVREILAFVVDALKDSGEQWNDAAKQDLVSTALIGAQKAGFLTIWERDAA